MRPLFALLALALVSIVSVAHADVTVSPPLRLRLDRVTVRSESTASEAALARALASLRAGVRARLPDVERCARRAEGGYAWRWDEAGRMRVRVSFDASGAVVETRTVSSDFARAISTCLGAALRQVRLDPPPDGSVVLLLGFERDAAW